MMMNVIRVCHYALLPWEEIICLLSLKSLSLMTLATFLCHLDLPINMTDMFELRLGLPGLGIGSTVSQGFHLGSSSMAHNFVSDDDYDFNLYSPPKKMRKS